MRHYSLFDQIISRFDKALNTIFFNSDPSIENLPNEEPDPMQTKSPLTAAERSYSCALMRINHSGEVCAQALYLGQALVARDSNLANQLQKAAKEEQTHLRWCKQRVNELGGKTSLLNPLWAIGSFGIGVAAGLVNDKISLGFLAETEQQVVLHLDKHLEKLPAKDTISRAILTQMREDEERHAIYARTEGGVPLPKSLCFGMSLASKIMTITTRYI
jgi:ubiquinone biosynthesis monooxygenase Coq7